MPLLEVEKLSVTIGGAGILSEVSFTLEPKEGIALVGPNGAGKTTVLRSLLHLIPGVTGTILINGEPAHQFSAKELAQLVGYVPQRLPLSFPYSVAEFVQMSRYAHESSLWRSPEGADGLLRESLEATQTYELRSRRLPELSGGELQRVLVAAALVQRPRILLLDEPAASLDPKHGKALHALLASLREKLALAVICVSHDLNAAIRHSSRIVALRSGKLFFDGLPQDFIKPPLLEDLYEIGFDRVSIGSEAECAVLPQV